MKFLILILFAFVLLITTSTEITFAQSGAIRVIPDSTNYDTSKFPQPEIDKDLFFIESESVHVVEAGVIDPKIPIIDITVNGFNPFLYPNRSDAPTPQNYLIVTINRDYMDSKLSNGQDDQFIVLLDGTEIYHEEVNRFPPDRTLKFKIPLGYGQHLEIVGTEFSKNYVSNSFQENENKLPVQNELTNSNPTITGKTVKNKEQTTQFEQENIISVEKPKEQFCFLFWCWDVEPKQESASSLNIRAEARMLEYVNEIRAENGVGNIKQVNELSQIAHASSSLSVEKGEIHNHEIGRKYDCSNVGGARTTGVAEVLTQEEVPLLYQINPENVGERFIDSWMGSDTGHREALLNPSYALGGFGVDSDLTKQYASGVFCPIR